MVEYTTIRISKPLASWIANIKSLQEFLYADKLSLEMGLFNICANADISFAEKLGLVGFDAKSKQDYLTSRISQFWADTEERPEVRLQDISKWWMDESDDKKKGTK